MEMLGDKISAYRERRERKRIAELKERWLRRQRAERKVWDDTVEYMGSIDGR